MSWWSRLVNVMRSDSPDFFKTMGTRVLEGREFQPRDGEPGGPMAAIVNESFARKYFPAQPAVGKRLTNRSRGQTIEHTIVGVVEDTRDGSVRGATTPFLFNPIPDAGGTLQLRSSVPPRVLADQLRNALPQVHPSLRLVDVTTQSALVSNALLKERLLAVLSGFFAALGLVLAAVGLYGVLSYVVVRRTREIGIRITLGARPPAVVRAILGRIGSAVLVGAVAGLAAGMYGARFVRTLLFDVEPEGIASVTLPLVLLLAVSVLTAWLPARRAARVDPAEALRME